MAWPRRDDNAVGPTAHVSHESERLLDRAGRIEHARVRHDAYEAAQDDLRDSVGPITIDGALAPPEVFAVARRILAVCVDQYVDVRKNQGIPPLEPVARQCRPSQHQVVDPDPVPS